MHLLLSEDLVNMQDTLFEVVKQTSMMKASYAYHYHLGRTASILGAPITMSYCPSKKISLCTVLCCVAGYAGYGWGGEANLDDEGPICRPLPLGKNCVKPWCIYLQCHTKSDKRIMYVLTVLCCAAGYAGYGWGGEANLEDEGPICRPLPLGKNCVKPWCVAAAAAMAAGFCWCHMTVGGPPPPEPGCVCVDGP